MPFATIQGGQLYYETHGSGPALIFAHGIGGNHLSWWQQVPHFRDRYTCVVFDHPGFGRSDDPPGDWSFCDSLAGLIDHLGVADVRLVAQSMGGWACMSYAISHPDHVTALVMADTSGAIDVPALAPVRAELGSQLGDRGAELFGRGIHPACGKRMFGEQPALHFLYTEIAALNPTTWSPNRRPGGMVRTPAVTRAQLQQLHAPTLYIIGDEDAAWSPRLLQIAAEATPGARVARVPEAGHSVYFERPARFNAIVDAFLAESG